MVVETVFSMLTLVCDFKRVKHRADSVYDEMKMTSNFSVHFPSIIFVVYVSL